MQSGFVVQTPRKCFVNVLIHNTVSMIYTLGNCVVLIEVTLPQHTAMNENIFVCVRMILFQRKTLSEVHILYNTQI